MSWVRAFHGIVIPQSGLLSQGSSLRLPLWHPDLVLTLSNAAHASLSSPCLLAADVTVGFNQSIIYLFFLPVILPSEIPRLATDPLVRVFPGVWKRLSFLRLPSWDRSPSLTLLSLFLSFTFCPTSFQRQWAAFLGAWCPLPAFRSCFVEFAQRANVLLMNLWGRKWSPVLFLHHLRTAAQSVYFQKI